MIEVSVVAVRAMEEWVESKGVGYSCGIKATRVE